MITYLKFEAKIRCYLYVDCSSHADYVKNMVKGASQIENAILVVSEVAGLMLQTREHVLLVKQVGVP